MEYLYPDYYGDFHCIASACEDTCCAGWQIAVDEKSLEKYKKVKGSFGNRLKNCINWKEQTFEQSHRRCAFLNEENLCDLYSELGAGALCKTCRRYPRHIEEFENLREIMLSLSCPEACRLILRQKDHTRFIRKEKETAYEEYETFDFLLFTKLEDAREFLLSLFQNEEIDLATKMAVALVFSHDFQRRLQQDQIYEVDDLILKYKGTSMIDDLGKKFQNFRGNYFEKMRWLRLVIEEYKSLEPLNKQWFSLLDTSLQTLERLGEKDYFHKRKQFSQSYDTLERELEQVMVTLLYTYFCGAVYDDDVLTKTKFVIMSVLLIRELDFARWLQNKECFTFADQIEIVHRYSKEIEHSDFNLIQLARGLKTLPKFHYSNILMGIFS